MNARIRDMEERDLAPAIELWRESKGVTVTGADTVENLAAFLDRNPRSSLVADAGGEIVGAVLGGHDGRRGYLHHLAVDRNWRRRGLGRRLAENALARLREAGIEKVHVFLEQDNPIAREFWARVGWIDRTDLRMMSRFLRRDPAPEITRG